MKTSLDALTQSALATSADLIIEVLEPSPYKRRLLFFDKSFLDLYLSQSRNGVYAFHYERRHCDGTIFRVDNYPHHRALKLRHFPHHFHVRRETTVKESPFGTNPDDVLRAFLVFIREHLATRKQPPRRRKTRTS